MNTIKRNETFKRIFGDSIVRCLFISVIIISVLTSSYLSVFFCIFTLCCFILGCILPLILIHYKENVYKVIKRIRNLLGYPRTEKLKSECDICEVRQCQRHKHDKMPREPWKGLLVDKNLDEAVESFYTRILNSFVKSWFSMLSKDDDFIQTLKQGLRESTCHIIRNIKEFNAATVITYKILPIIFEHIEIVQTMLNDGITLDKLPNGFIKNDRPIHPAVTNRQAEMDYLRAVAKCLIPRLFHSENFDSKIFFSLVREIISCWVLLPLMDAISDPNLINLIIIHITNKSNTKNVKKKLYGGGLGGGGGGGNNNNKVEFLKNFINKNGNIIINCGEGLLNDNDKLYSFMQFLKKEGAVDILRFYLDVDNLNKELQDPKVTTDPAKLSTLYKQSEKLLQDYYNLMQTNEMKATKVSSLTEAHENIKASLEGKWQKAFSKTPEYYKLIYGSKEIQLIDYSKNSEQTGTVSRLGSKLKDAIRGAIDGAPLDATEVPTVWDALAEPQMIPSNQTIYNSVTQKLRKERGQNLDVFLATFMQSLDESVEIQGENLEIYNNNSSNKTKKESHHHHHHHHVPGRNLVFGNLFGLNKTSKSIQITSGVSFNIKGPSQCLLYIVSRLLNAPIIFVRLLFAFICISPNMVDTFICQIINKLIKSGLYEPRLAMLIRLLEQHLFDGKHTEISPSELVERQRQARKRIENLWNGSGYLADVLQSPALNKHLMYCIFDVILSEMYPEFGH